MKKGLLAEGISALAEPECVFASKFNNLEQRFRLLNRFLATSAEALY